ncbi:MAG TPA: aldo/keto reductase [Gemmatimonadaceae bacterium]|nr:aldo/keto reductase [Gemmatimonadaceae bacterium]
MTVERMTLAPGLEIARAITGLWQVADLERDGTRVDASAAAVEMARYAAGGYTTFDLADHYGSAEDLVGEFRTREAEAAHCRFFTKWVPGPGPVTREMVRAAVDRACSRMRTERIDLLQYHAWSYADPGWIDALFHLAALRREGRIAQLGLTNFDTAHLRIALASGIPIVSNQVSCSLLDRRAAGAMSELCLASGVRLLAYGTVAGGWLSDRWLGAPEPDWERTGTWSQMKYGRFLRVAGGWDALQRLLAALKPIAQRHGVSIANVASRAVLEMPAVAGVIIGARLGASEHRQDNLRLFSFALTNRDREELAAVLATLQPIPGDCGDEYRRPPYLTAAGDLSHHLEHLPPPFHTEPGAAGRVIALSGTTWEEAAGFARAVRVGDRILVSGTTATHAGHPIGGSDPTAQTHFAIDKIEGALQSLGARLEQVVRTRVYVRHMEDWEAIARAHGERFGAIRPANTLVRADLVGDEYLVEIEAEAVVGTVLPGTSD